jgi:predicted ATPase
MSDGTLRILALIAIAYDPEFAGIVILEEPENGVHPGRIKQVVELLQSLSGLSNPVRQMIVNTHSSKLIEVVQGIENLVIATPKRVISQEHGVYSTTHMSYVQPYTLLTPEGQFTRSQVASILESQG